MRFSKNVFLILFFGFAIVSCDNDSNEDQLDEDLFKNTKPGDFHVDFDGKTYKADIVEAIDYGETVSIAANKKDIDETVLITLFIEDLVVGTYELGVKTNMAAYYKTSQSGVNEAWVATIDGVTVRGEVVITEINPTNKTISGTFFFTGSTPPNHEREKLFNKGVFNAIPFE